MGTTTLLSLDQKLLENIGDWRQETVTTELAASTALVCTDLNKWTLREDFFIDWHVYVEDFANAGIDKLISGYEAGTTRITTLSAWSADAASTTATFRLSRYASFDERKLAITDTIQEVYPALHRKIDNITLVSSNILPNAHFEDWIASSTKPDFYTAASGTTSANTTVTTIRGGAKSMKVSANGSADYAYITSYDYPRLLDLQDRTVNAKVWVYPEVASSATITVYTIDKAGSAQTLASTTASAASTWTLLNLLNQELNDDLVEVQIRFGVTTDTKWAYFDNARVTGLDQLEYLLPDDFADGSIRQVWIQEEGYADDPCDDLHPRSWERVYGWEIIDDGSYKYIRMPFLYNNPYLIRLIGDAPLEDLSAATNALAAAKTISLDNQQLRMLIEYASYLLFVRLSSGVSSEDREHYERESLKHLAKYEMLKRRHAMPRMPATMKLGLGDGFSTRQTRYRSTSTRW